MTLEEYTSFTRMTGAGIKSDMTIPVLALGLAGETGEVCDKLKKHIRVGGSAEDFDLLGFKKELGDVLWYLTRLADEFGLTMDEVIETNVVKLQDRIKRDVVFGSGDNR